MGFNSGPEFSGGNPEIRGAAIEAGRDTTDDQPFCRKAYNTDGECILFDSCDFSRKTGFFVQVEFGNCTREILGSSVIAQTILPPKTQ